jgi:flavodoxin
MKEKMGPLPKSELTEIPQKEIAAEALPESIKLRMPWEARTSAQEKEEYVEEVSTLEQNFDTKVDDLDRFIGQFYGAFSRDVSEIPSPSSIEAVEQQIAALDRRMVDGRGYIAHAEPILLQLRRLSSDAKSAVDADEYLKTELLARAEEAKAKQDIFNAKGLIERVKNHSEMRNHQRLVDDLNGRITMIDKTIEKRRLKLITVDHVKNAVEDRMSNVMQGEMGKPEIAAAIGRPLKKLSDATGEKSPFIGVIEDTYIEGTLAPMFDRVMKEEREQRIIKRGGADGLKSFEEEKKEFFSELRRHLSGDWDDWNSVGALRQMINKAPEELSRACAPLMKKIERRGGPAEEILSSLFIQYTGERISRGKNALKKEKEKVALADREGDNRKITRDYYFEYPDRFRELPINMQWRLNEDLAAQDDLPPDLQVWAVLKNDPSLRRAFGTVVDTMDQRWRDKFLKRALNDQNGGFIEQLSYYPGPESIKTLVLLSAADGDGHRKYHAKRILEAMVRRPDWQALFDDAKARYPELENAQSGFEEWTKGRPYVDDPKVSKLARALLENEANNEAQSRVAVEVLSGEELVDLLESEGKLEADKIDLLRQVFKMKDDQGMEFDLEYFLRDSLRGAVLTALTRGEKRGDSSKQEKDISNHNMAVVFTLSGKLVENKGNAFAARHLTSAYLIEKLKGENLSLDQKEALLSAYQELPNIAGDTPTFKIFCEFFEGQSTTEFYKRLYEAYGEENSVSVAQIARLVGMKALTLERAIALAKPIMTARGEVNFLTLNTECREMAFERPELLLQTDDGLDFLQHINVRGGIDGMDIELDSAMGKRALTDSKNDNARMARRVLAMEAKNKVMPLLAEGNIPTVDGTNWQGLTAAYVGATGGEWAWGGKDPLEGHTDQMEKVFATSEAKNRALGEMRGLWFQYLERGTPEDFPLSLTYLNQFIKSADGAGPLSQIESFSEFTDACAAMLKNKSTATRTKGEVAGGLLSAERRFSKERWSNEDMADFYNVSRDVLSAAPSLFASYGVLFEGLKAKEFKEFSGELFPLHRVFLSLSEKRDRYGVMTHDPRDLARIREYVRQASEESGVLKPIEAQKKELTAKILELFKDKFGIVAIPEHMSPEHIRALSDYSRYLANLSRRDAGKEDILSFYLALTVNDRWDDFRRGEVIDPGDYLTSGKAARLTPYLKRRAELNPVTPGNLGIDAEKMPQFMKVLQEESESVATGNVETVDVKLNNTIENLRGLEDLDLYPDAMDKKRMGLLLEYGNKKVGAVAARIYQSLTRPGGRVEWSDEESEIRADITTALEENGLAFTSENVKKIFQDEIKPLAVVANILRFVEETGVEREIDELRELLKPSAEVMAVFNKMGEEFKPTSGAMAISQDLEYLDNVIVKEEQGLSEQEAMLVKSYLADVRQKLAVLEDIYDLIGKKFATMKQGQAETKNELLRGKLEEISKIIARPGSEHMILSGMTHSMPYVIENIRECLSCMRQGANNDTNLTLGDSNKFYLSSRSEMKAGSISDEMAFFEPITLPNGTTSMAFVLDRVYGTNTPSILINQIQSVYKKYAKLKREFPEAKISILVSEAAIQTGGLSGKLLVEKLREKVGEHVGIEEVSHLEVMVAESSAGDHYVEFGGSARSAGARPVSGVLVSS